MPESQATAPKTFAPSPKRPKSRIAGWIVIFLCAQVGFNVAKRHIRENFKGSANEIVSAQPQGFPREQQANYGRKGPQEPRYVRLPTLSAKHARVGGRTSTLTSRIPQGSKARNRAFKRPSGLARKVSYRTKICIGLGNFWAKNGT